MLTRHLWLRDASFPYIFKCVWKQKISEQGLLHPDWLDFSLSLIDLSFLSVLPFLYAVARSFGLSTELPHLYLERYSSGQEGSLLICQAVRGARVRTPPSPPLGRIAQLVAHSADKRKVGGSNPPTPTKSILSSIICGGIDTVVEVVQLKEQFTDK